MGHSKFGTFTLALTLYQSSHAPSDLTYIHGWVKGKGKWWDDRDCYIMLLGKNSRV